MVSLVCMTWVASAQNRTATGVVNDNIGPVIGAGVVVAGTNNGAITDVDGSFTLNNVPVGSTLVVSCIGYETVEVVFNGQPVKVTLREDSELLDEVVVTALGITREKKSLGYAVQDVKAEELTRGGGVTLTDALMGKVAGLSINNSATGAGGSTRVVLRGNSSLSDNNSPLYVVDGVPYDNGGTPGADQAGLWGSIDHQGGAFDINPEDIESVSVLKGATAAALYGSRAGNGVILITTKKGGKANKKIGISYSGKFTWSPVSYFPNMQNVYGQGSLGQYDAQSTGSWGPALSASTMVANWWDGSTQIPFMGDANPWTEFYRTGSSQSNNVTIAGGNQDNPFRLTLGYDNTNSVVKTSNIKRTSVDFVTSNKITDWLKLDLKANYVNTAGNNRQPRGAYGSSFNIITMPRNIRMADLAAHWLDEIAAASGPGYEAQINWHEVSPNCQNPYFIQSNLDAGDVQNKFFGVGSITINFTKNLSLKVKEGLTWAGVTDKTKRLYDTSGFNWPEFSMKTTTTFENNLEGLLSYNNKWGDFDFGASLGGNIMHYKQEVLRALAKNIPFPGAYYVSAGSLDGDTWNSIYEKQINSIYAFANLGWKNFLYLDVTARNDWSSTLPKANRSYFYPSVSGVVVFTQPLIDAGIMDDNVFSFGKLRASWAEVGKDTNPYVTSTQLWPAGDYFGIYSAGNYWSKGNPILRPERTRSTEIGLELSFFKNRLHLDYAFYTNNSYDQILSPRTSQATGYIFCAINAGNVLNKGMELTISGTPVQTKEFVWESSLNVAGNRGKMTNFPQGLTAMYVTDVQYGTAKAGTIKDGCFMGIAGYKFVRDDNGEIILDKNGFPTHTGDYVEVGNREATFTGGFNNTFSWKGFTLNMLWEFRVGGDVYNGTKYAMTQSGVSQFSADIRNQPLTISGVDSKGNPVTNTWEPDKVYSFNGVQKLGVNIIQDYYTNYYPYETSNYITSVNLLRLRNLSLTYDVPTKALSKLGFIKRAAFTLSANNLLLFTNYEGDPEVAAAGAGVGGSSSVGFDYCGVPAMSGMSFGVNLTF